MAERSDPTVAVVICTHNRPALLERCLQHLEQVDNPDFSIVVVDSAPNSSEAKSISTRYGTQYVLSPQKGLSRARNVGVRATESDIIAFLDDDMIPHPRWLNSLVAEFVDRVVMAATGPVLDSELSEGTDV